MSMTRAEREEFLAGLHVGVLSISEDGRGPLTVPIWYGYEPGGAVRIVTGRGSRKARALAKAARASMCVQSESPPYRYVSVEGPVTLETPDYDRDIRALAVRYLGEQAAAQYLRVSGSTVDGTVLVVLRPERWLSVDFGKR
jgi:PPOX class probable F420-dependent enzyme